MERGQDQAVLAARAAAVLGVAFVWEEHEGPPHRTGHNCWCWVEERLRCMSGPLHQETWELIEHEAQMTYPKPDDPRALAELRALFQALGLRRVIPYLPRIAGDV